MASDIEKKIERLREGVHACSIEHVRDRFGRFQRSDRRIALCSKLTALVEELRSTELVAWVGVDGSFVTAKPEPGDVDLVLVLKGALDPGTLKLTPFDYQVLRHKSIKKKYGFDAIVVPEGSSGLTEALAFFAQTREDPARRKGLLRIDV